MASLIRMSPLVPTAAERFRESVMTTPREALLKEHQAVQQQIADKLQLLVQVTAQQRVGPVPSHAALQIIWSLGPVRDALCDQKAPAWDHTNKQIKRRLNDSAVQQHVLPWLDQHYGVGPGSVAAAYRQQFEPLPDPGLTPFEQSRRKRLAELAAFEQRVMIEVVEDRQHGKPLPDQAPAQP